MTSARRTRIVQAVKSYLNGDDLPPVTETVPQEDMAAAGYAFDELSCDRCAVEKIAFAILIFDRGKTMTQAAERCYISYATAKRWKKQIMDLVDKHLPQASPKAPPQASP